MKTYCDKYTYADNMWYISTVRNYKCVFQRGYFSIFLRIKIIKKKLLCRTILHISMIRAQMVALIVKEVVSIILMSEVYFILKNF